MRTFEGEWSEDGQIFFCEGYGWGLTETLKTICLGKEADIKKFFDTGELNNELDPTRKQVLNGILEYRKEQGIGNQPKTERVSDFRGRPIRDVKHRVQTSQRATPSKRVALCQTKRKKSGVSIK